MKTLRELNPLNAFFDVLPVPVTIPRTNTITLIKDANHYLKTNGYGRGARLKEVLVKSKKGDKLVFRYQFRGVPAMKLSPHKYFKSVRGAMNMLFSIESGWLSKRIKETRKRLFD